MSQPLAIYRFTRPITLLVWQTDRYRLAQLPQDTIISVGDPKLDANHMIHGTYRGDRILLFSIDLEERAELLLTRCEMERPVNGSEQAMPDAEITPLEVAEQVASELRGRGHLAFVLDAVKKPADPGVIKPPDHDHEHHPVGRCS